MSCRRLCIMSFQDWSGAARNRSIQGIIDHFGAGTSSAESVLHQLQSTLQLSQSIAAAWSDGAVPDCAVTYNVSLHQRDLTLHGASSLSSQDERRASALHRLDPHPCLIVTHSVATTRKGHWSAMGKCVIPCLNTLSATRFYQQML